MLWGGDAGEVDVRRIPCADKRMVLAMATTWCIAIGVGCSKAVNSGVDIAPSPASWLSLWLTFHRLYGMAAKQSLES